MKAYNMTEFFCFQGIDKISNEMSEASELIDPVHGHGSQSLINLMLTGRAVSYVWDHEQDVGGLSKFCTVLLSAMYTDVACPMWK